MELTTEQIDFIQQDVQQRGVTMHGLTDSLVDHICCVIENNTEDNEFYKAYQKAIETFGMRGLEKTQRDTIFLLNLKKEIIMKATMYLLGYVAIFLCSTAFLFKIMHWPGASVILVLGVVLLNLGFLPMYFYDRYKRSIA